MAFKYHVLQGKNELVTCAYGSRTYKMNGYWVSDFHNGIDLIKAPCSLDHVIAYQSGKVIAVLNCVSGFNTAPAYSAGNYVIIQHRGGYVTKYFHMALNTIRVRVGDVVKRGQVLGYMGSTGWSNGAHLHFGVYLNNKMQDPYPYLTGSKTIPAWTVPVKKMKVKATTYLRSDSHNKAKRLVKIPKGKTVSWYSDDKWGWSKIKYAGKVGYVMNMRLVSSKLSPFKKFKPTETVYLLEKPNSGAKHVIAVPKGKSATLYSILPNGWIYGNYGKKKGYIYFNANKIKIK